MNYSDYRFTLDVQIHQAQVSVPVTFGDSARRLCIGLTDGRKPYVIGEGCRAVFNAKKPDGKVIKNDCIIERNTILYEFTPNTTNAEGIVYCDITLVDKDGKVLTSPQFIIVVDKRVVKDEEILSILSDSESTTLDRLIAIADDIEKTGLTIWQTTSNLTGAGFENSPRYEKSILIPIEGREPQKNDYIVDAVGNLVQITSVDTNANLIYVLCVSSHIADDQYIWETDEDLTGVGIDVSPQVSVSVIKPANGRTPQNNDYVIDSVGNILQVTGTMDEYVLLRVVVSARSGAEIGDIQAALDGILAIQENLIGTITFTIEYNDKEGNTHIPQYTALKGMTWAEWVISQYNTDGILHIQAENGNQQLCYEATGDRVINEETQEYQYPTTVIVDGAAYLHD